jgi:hypothetical protein
MSGEPSGLRATVCICSGVAPYGYMPADFARACISSSSSFVNWGLRLKKLMPSKTRTPPLSRHWN